MRFKIGFISIAIIASFVNAVPTKLSNTGINAKEYQDIQFYPLEIKKVFVDIFHQKEENDNFINLREPSEFDFSIGQ